MQTDPDEHLGSESVHVSQMQIFFPSLCQQLYELIADQIQQLKYQWDSELIWCPITFFDIAIQQLNVLVSRV